MLSYQVPGRGDLATIFRPYETGIYQRITASHYSVLRLFYISVGQMDATLFRCEKWMTSSVDGSSLSCLSFLSLEALLISEAGLQKRSRVSSAFHTRTTPRVFSRGHGATAVFLETYY